MRRTSIYSKSIEYRKNTCIRKFRKCTGRVHVGLGCTVLGLLKPWLLLVSQFRAVRFMNILWIYFFHFIPEVKGRSLGSSSRICTSIIYYPPIRTAIIYCSTIRTNYGLCYSMPFLNFQCQYSPIYCILNCMAS